VLLEKNVHAGKEVARSGSGVQAVEAWVAILVMKSFRDILA